jgi:serine/threonine protein kinase
LNDSSANLNVDHELLDQLVEQFTARIRAGETPSIADYQARYPTWSDEIHELLSSAAMIEGLKRQTGLPGTGRRPPFEELSEMQRLGEYRIVRELGRGGMGIVLEAEHDSLGRRVAIKVLPQRLLVDQKNIERFTREARAAATLHHNNIVSVFGVGHSDGYYYYVMEYVDGCGLDQVLSRMRVQTRRSPDATVLAQTVADLPPASSHEPGAAAGETDFEIPCTAKATRLAMEAVIPAGVARYAWAARIVADVADALHYAHGRGVLHRDIKPGNLLLDPAGRVWLTDFGLVKDLTNQTMTVAGDIIGTPQYMAPESFEARYDVASEIWCLGATLYELVTLRPMIEPGGTGEVIRRVTSCQAGRPRKVDPRVPADLSTIIEKATSRDPADRYASADLLRDDLHAFLQNRPLRARPPSIPRRLYLWSKRNPWQALSAALTGLVALLATAGFLSRSASLQQSRAQNEQLRIERDKTERARIEADRNADMYREQYERAEANVDLSLEMFDQMFKQMLLRGTGRTASFSFDSLQDLSGIETTVSPEDARYLEDMLVFLEKFARENSGNAKLAAEAAKSYRRVANIYHLLGKFESARDAYQKSVALYESLNADQPAMQTTVEQAQTANELGVLWLNQGAIRQALKIFREVRDRLQASPYAGTASMQLELVKTLGLMGNSAPIRTTDMAGWATRADASGTSWQRAGLRRIRNRTVRKWGDENLQYVRQAVDVVNQLVDTHGSSPELLLERARCYLRVAELQYWMDQPEDSRQARQQAVADLSQITASMPESPDFRAVLAQAWAMPIGEDDSESRRQLTRAGQIIGELCESFPGNTDYLQLDADVNDQLGQLARESHELSEAAEHYQRALESISQAWQLLPRNQPILLRVNQLTLELGDLLVEQQRYREARDLLSENVRRMSRQFRRRSAARNAAGRALLERQCGLLADCHDALDEPATAAAIRNLARELRQRPPTSRSSRPRRDPE